MTVIAVGVHTKNYGVDQPSRVETYLPYDQWARGGGNLLIRFVGDASGLASSIRASAHSLDPDVPIGPGTRSRRNRQ